MLEVETRKCKKCGEEYELTNEYFRPEKTNKTGWSYSCRKCISEYGKKYYKENKEKLKDYSLNRHYEKRDECLEYMKEYRKNNNDYMTKKSRDWYENNKDQWKEYIKNYQQENPELFREYQKKRIENKKHDIKKEEWESCKEYFDYSCAYCGLTCIEHKKIYNQDLHKEHVDHQGANDLSNCVPSCRICNSHKHIYELKEWYTVENPIFEMGRLNKIVKWLVDDYKKYKK